MADSFQVGQGDVKFRVFGYRKAVRDLERAGVASDDLKKVMSDVGSIVVRNAKVPQRTGRLDRTLRAGKGKTKSVVRLGGARAPYAGVRNYGWPARNIPAMNPSLEDTVKASQQEIFETVENGIQDLLVKNGLQKPT